MQWFKHDTSANMDAKLQDVLLDYGLEGYGLYWYCIELIAGKISKDNLTFSLEHDARIIARNTGSSPQKVQEMMKRFIDIGLFENSDGVITCLKLAKRLDQSMTSNTKMRELISEIKNHDAVMTESSKILTASCKNRIEENRKDKSNQKDKQKRFTSPSIQDVSTYCQERKNNVDAHKFVDYYTANGWKVGKNSMKDWKAAIRTWEKNNTNSNQPKATARPNLMNIMENQ